jgi:hypothetical protein
MRTVTRLLTLGSMVVGIGAASALDFDFSGTFTKDDDIARFNFTVGGENPSLVTVFSSSWDDGGFDPILAIWTAAGVQMAEQDDGGVEGSTLSNAVSYDHGVWDSYYQVSLDPGDYIATVGQYSNFANSTDLADGFRHEGNPNFTFDLGYGQAPLFNGVWTENDPRQGFYVFHILNVAEATHEPPINGVPDAGSTLVLFGIALAGLVCGKRRVA